MRFLFVFKLSWVCLEYFLDSHKFYYIGSGYQKKKTDYDEVYDVVNASWT